MVIRANTRIATLRSTLVEQGRRLNIEMVGLEAAITWKKTAAERQQEAEARYGDVCAALYDAARPDTLVADDVEWSLLLLSPRSARV